MTAKAGDGQGILDYVLLDTLNIALKNLSCYCNDAFLVQWYLGLRALVSSMLVLFPVTSPEEKRKKELNRDAKSLGELA